MLMPQRSALVNTPRRSRLGGLALVCCLALPRAARGEVDGALALQTTDALPAPASAPPPTPALPTEPVPEAAPPAVDAGAPKTPTPESAPLTAEESAALAALSSELSPGPETLDLDEPQIDLYGFADLTYVTQVGKKVAFAQHHASFMVGGFNVYFSTEFERRWRSLAEVRFMYLPNGGYAGETQYAAVQGSARADTSVLDPADLNKPVRWGGVAIQRVWLEYRLSNYLTLRAGQWLTPYGIWNVDHGTPTIINVYRPYILNENLFPERQTGLEAYGSFFAGDTKLGYHLTLSNGRGPIDTYLDLDDNKAVGARLFAQNDALLGTLTFGVSAYRGNYTERSGNGTTIEDGELVIFDPPTEKYSELALAADLKWEWEGFYLQSEAILSELRYSDAARPSYSPLPPAPVPTQIADSRRYGAYALLGYRTRWNIMPFVLGQLYHNPLISDSRELAVGVNFRPSPRVALKAEYKYVFIEDPPGLILGDIDFLGLQVAWSF